MPKMCGKVLVTLLLLATSYGVSALATAFLSDAGHHVRGRIAWLTSTRRRPLGCRQAATRPLRLRSSCIRPLSEAVSSSTRHEAGFVLTERGEGKDSEGGGDDDVCKEETRVVLESYASRHSTPETSALASVREDTIREQPRGAHMVSGHLQGELLKLLTRLSGAKKVLDIGTFTGYSALAFAEALPEDGIVVTLESDERAAETARRYFTDSDHGGKIRLLLGQAMDTIDQLIAEDVWQFDVIFIDADKKRYWDYYNKVLEGPRPLLAEGGVLLADNVLFHDMVPMAEENASEENLKLSASTNSGIRGGKGGGISVPTPRRLKIARSLDDFNKRVQGDDRVRVLLLPLRDGLSVIRWREGKYPNQARM